MSMLTYQLSPPRNLSNHAWYDVLFLRDEADIPDNTTDYRIDALVRSGDYFVTLATVLDNLEVDSSDYRSQMLIDTTTSDLMYLQDNYKITKKD